MRYALIVSAFLTALSSNAQPDSDLIREARQQSNQSIARHDTATMASFWLDDVHVVTSRTVELHGKKANQRAFQQEFQTKEKLLYVRTPSTIEVFDRWNMAAEYGRWTGTWKSKGASIKVGGSYYAKWHKLNGTWKIRSETYTPSSCEGGDYCTSFVLPAAGSTIIVQNLYFPKPGMESEVLHARRRASQVREQLGLAVGRILLRTSGSNSQPYIIWECEYPSLEAREEDVAALDKSEEFTQIQQHMGTLLEKFDRSMWQTVR